MCESTVYKREGDNEVQVMENVARIEPAGDNKYIIRGLFGESMEVEGVLENIDLLGHKIIFR